MRRLPPVTCRSGVLLVRKFGLPILALVIALVAGGGGRWAASITYAQGPASAPADPTFQTIDLEPIANAPIDHIAAPTGRRIFAGVPFYIRSGERACFHTQHQGHPEFPTEATLPLSARSATAVHVLLTGAYVVSVEPSRTVGDITLSFVDGVVLTVPIVAWSSIREDWRYADEPARPMTPPAALVSWDNVFEQPQARGDRPAVGAIDRVKLDIPESLSRVGLSSVRFRDTSLTTAQSIDSSIRVMAVTLESR